MNIYRQKFYWKIGLVILAILIVVASLFYNNRLAKQLSKEERKKVELYAETQRENIKMNESFQEYVKAIKALEKNYGKEVTEQIPPFPDATNIILNIIRSNTTIPVIISNDSTFLQFVNFKIEMAKTHEDSCYILDELERLKAGFEPISISITDDRKQYLYYDQSTLLTQLKWYPFVQLGTIGAFLLIAYLAFSSARRAEQDHVWVGMARETAHQLGTPLSSLSAWIDLLEANDDANVQEIGKEMNRDTTRLNLIADRFSKIGSKPKLEEYDLILYLQKTLNYVKRRASKKIVFTNNFDLIGDIPTKFSPPLLDWVVENLLKNALDAMDKGEGSIDVKVEDTVNNIIIDVSDTGKGIKGNFNDVFKPGYTTKGKRGWGLGLSLSKRIVEEYHKGKIHVLKSVVGEGTTFRIILPK